MHRCAILQSWRLLAFSLFSCSLAYSNPSDPTVMSGSASFANAVPQALAITTSDQAVINWNEFSIAEGELTQFFQPSSQSIVVNRVTSELSSVLLGSLKANGKIFLLNPNGVLIGENASIDTSSFIASTLSVNPQDLLAGNQDVLFHGSSTATIVNMGTISAWDGDVYLIGYQIDNKGAIDAPSGTVAIGAGQEILLQPMASEKIVIRPSQTKYEHSSSIDNSGMIAACRAELKADGNAYSMAINHTGSIDALGIQDQNGEVFLVSGNGNNGVYGTITARNPDKTGGSVQILGDHIALLNNALVDASGELGGGTVLVGGDLSGANPIIPNALTTYIDKNTTVRADSLMDGNGGKVIAWAEETTCFYGTISTRGGENSGDGGFVEVSGKRSLDFNGAADRLAPQGKAGTLLLDPYDITVSNAGNNNVTGASPFTPTGTPANLMVSTLTGALGGGNVIVQTAPGGAANGTITVSSAMNYNSTNTLTFTTNVAGVTVGDININQNIFNFGAGQIIIDSIHDVNITDAWIDTVLPAFINVTAGRDLNMSSPTIITVIQPWNIVQAGRNITMTAIADVVNLNNNNAAGTLTALTGNLILIGGSGSGAYSAISGAPLTINVPNGHIELTGGSGPVNVFASLIGGGSAPFNLNCAGHLYLTGGTNGAASVASVGSASGDVNINMSGLVGPNPGYVIMDAGTGLGGGASTVIYTGSGGGHLTINTPTEVQINNTTQPFLQSNITRMNQTGDITINANRVTMNGSGANNLCQIYNNLGNIYINSGQDFTMTGGSFVGVAPSSTPGPYTIQIIANTNISIDATSSITNNTTSGPVTLVVDNFFPTPPLYGPGFFSNQGVITTTNGPLWIFTSRRPLNTQTGILNGGPFIPGPIYVDSATERWYTWYNNTSNGLPYKVFYKDLYTPSPVQMQTALTNFNAAAYEFLQTLQNYDVFWYWRTQFSSQYDKKEYMQFHHHEGLTSSDVFGKKQFHLLRKSYKELNGKVIYLIR